MKLKITGRLGSACLVAGSLSALLPGTASAGTTAPSPPSEVAVKMSTVFCTPSSLAPSLQIVVDRAIVASRGLYQVHSSDPHYVGPDHARELADQISHQPCVSYAEPDLSLSMTDSQFHSWPDGLPGTATSAVDDQPAAQQLGLGAVHALSTGAGTIVAVLDTGVDANAPLLKGHVTSGWDYVGDDADTLDQADGIDSNGNGLVDESYGHGTFVAGMVEMVAPDATIMPMRVLDSDGVGNLFAIAQAITDSVAAGANVINLSFGTAVNVQSQVLRDAIAQAIKQGVVVVAAAGNDGSTKEHFPAAFPGVVGVGALTAVPSSLTPFSCRGGWVDVAAPGDDLIGPFPGGRLVSWSGTSMAAPIVAGQFALLRAYRPATPFNKFKDVVENSAIHISGPNHGSVDLLASLRRLVTG